MGFEVIDFSKYGAELERMGVAVEQRLTGDMVGVEIGKGKAQRTVLAPTDKIVMTFDSGHSKKQKSDTLGMHSPNRWNVDGEDCDLISINPYTLDRSAVSIAETVIHEMIHHIARESDIKDTSRGGYYHGQNFRELCDASGLLEWVENEKYGCITKLSKSGESWVDEILQPEFGNMFKNMEAPAKKKNGAIKFECHCGTKATVQSTRLVEQGFTPMCNFAHEPEYMVQVVQAEEN
jgi:hypothetical protein